MIAIIDYDAGNIKSVAKALQKLGAEVVITKDPKVILDADKVILPGVGAFGDAMAKSAGGFLFVGDGAVFRDLFGIATSF